MNALLKSQFGISLVLALAVPASVEFAAASSPKEEFDQLKESCFISHEGESGLAEECQEGPALAEKVLKTDPDNIEVLYKYSRLLLKDLRRKEAKIVWEKILKLDPDHVGSLEYIELYSYSMDKKKKLKLLKRIVELEPNHPRAYWSLAVTFVSLGREKDAADAMKAHIGLIKKGVEVQRLSSVMNSFVNQMTDKGFTRELPDVIFEYVSVSKGGPMVCFNAKDYQKRLKLKSKKLGEAVKEFCSGEE